MKICYVHGAGASERSFVWLEEHLPKHTASCFTYSINESLFSSITRLNKFVLDHKTDIIIGHSLGGVMAAACDNIKKVVSICAPFGGMKYAEFMYMFSLEQLYYDLRTHGPILSSIRSKPLTKPHLAIVGTSGLPFTSQANDGVVTVESQTALFGPHYELLKLNHFEVLMSKEVSTLITNFMKE